MQSCRVLVRSEPILSQYSKAIRYFVNGRSKCASKCCVVSIVDSHTALIALHLSLNSGLHKVVLEELLVEEAHFIVE